MYFNIWKLINQNQLQIGQNSKYKTLDLELFYKVAFDQNLSALQKYRENTFGKSTKLKIQTETHVSF